MKTYHLLLVIGILSACGKVSKTASTENIIALDSGNVKFIDSLKWLFYVANYKERLPSYSIQQDSMSEVLPIECNVSINQMKVKGDSIIYELAFVKQPFTYSHSTEGDILNVFYQEDSSISVGSMANKVYTFQTNKDSLKVFFQERERSFKEYLKVNHSKACYWLKQYANIHSIM